MANETTTTGKVKGTGASAAPSAPPAPVESKSDNGAATQPAPVATEKRDLRKLTAAQLLIEEARMCALRCLAQGAGGLDSAVSAAADRLASAADGKVDTEDLFRITGRAHAVVTGADGEPTVIKGHAGASDDALGESATSKRGWILTLLDYAAGRKGARKGK